ncbi:MAG: YkgJ family cysteine cluster protein [Candidatus Bathyarchaeia archaeon]
MKTDTPVSPAIQLREIDKLGELSPVITKRASDAAQSLLSKVRLKLRDLLDPYPLMEEDLDAVCRLDLLMRPNPLLLGLFLKIQNEFCLKCGECCRRNTPINIHKREAERIAAHLRMPYKEFKRRYRLKVRGDHTLDLPAAPCPFLKGNLCSIYPIRPDVCRYFPIGRMAADAIERWQIILIPYCGIAVSFFAIEALGGIIGRIVERENPELRERMKREVEEYFKPLKEMPEKEAFLYSFLGGMRMSEEIGRENSRRA